MKKIYLLSLFMALVVGIAVYFFASSIEQKAELQAVAKGQVVVAVMEIPENTLITEDMVTLVTLSSEGINSYAATSLSQVIGAINKYPLLPNQQVLSPQLVEKGKDDGTLSLALEDGKRAISVGVDDISGVSGYIVKGDYVDVIATVIPSGSNNPISTSLVENVLVLEVDIKMVEADTAKSYTTVTLSVTPADALKINYASSNGKLRLVLRPILDDKIVNPGNYSS